MHRFYYEGTIGHPPFHIRLSKRESHHLRNVLRLKQNDKIIVFNDSGFEYTAIIAGVSSAEVEITLLEERLGMGELPFGLTLAFALTRGKKIEFLLQKAVELGVQTFQPLITERAVRIEPGESIKNRWEDIITDAAKQCGRTRRMKLAETVHFDAYLTETKEFELCIIPTTNPAHNQIKISSLDKVKNASNILLVIGPEGGFTLQEIQSAIVRNFQPVNLGRRILRSETAALSGVIQILSLKGEL